MSMTLEKYFKITHYTEGVIKAYYEIADKLAETNLLSEADAMLDIYEQGDAVFAPAAEALAGKIGMEMEQLVLYVYVRYVTERTWLKYVEKGIPEEIYAASEGSFCRCAEAHYKKHGFYGVSNLTYRAWYRRNLNMTIFRLGRLEFETVNYKGPENDLCKEGDPVINVHIPRKDDMSDEICEAAYDTARAFFKKYFGMERIVFMCHSWLMDPYWDECLKPGSKIRTFQRHYKILEATPNNKTAIGWIFPQYEENLDNYPTDTSLRRAAIEKLRSGGSLCVGFGVRE